MTGPIRAAATPIAIAQPNSAPVGWLKPGMPGRASENVPSPVRLSRPMKMSEPIPAASSPGSSTTPSIGPPSPDASISKNAPVRGDPSSVLTAAKAPVTPSTLAAWSGTSRRRASRMTRAASPPPSAISGISGPSTAPKTSVASAARMTPGSWTAVGGACTAKAPAAEGPPLPGRYRMAKPASTPPTASTGSGHHTGSVAETEPVRKVGEDLLLQVVDEGQEAVGDRGDRHAQDRGQHQQPHVIAAAQQGHRVRRARCVR